jgi:ABC-2 type transport system permease protein
MNKQAIWAIATKDMRAISTNLQVWLPMLILPLVMGVIIPGALIITLSLYGLESAGDLSDLTQWLDKIPPSSLKTLLDNLPTVDHRIAFLLANFMFAPFFLMIPLMTSSVVLAAFVPSVGLSLFTFVLCAVTVNLAGWPLFGGIFFPRLNWLPLLMLVIPMISLTTIFLNIFISARVATFQAAYQMGGLLVLPVVLLLVGQASGLLLLDTGLLVGVGLALAALNAVLLWVIVGRMDRNRLFESQIR